MMGSVTDNPFWLALGAFLTSPGFGGLATGGGAIVAFVNIARAGKENRALAVENDARERWWQLLMWLYDHHDEANAYDPLIVARTIKVLGDLSSTQEQAAMLEMVGRLTLVPEALDDADEEADSDDT